MYDRILVPLDGSKFGEEILPYADALARPLGAELVLMRVVEDEGERAAAEVYLQGRARPLDAETKLTMAQKDVQASVVDEVRRQPRTLAAMTTHGRTGLLEAVLGGVALGVVRSLHQPVLLYRPKGGVEPPEPEREERISTIVAPLDGSEFAEEVLPHAGDLAKALDADLTLVQAVSARGRVPASVPPGDVLESSYVRGKAREVGEHYGTRMDWDVLHGDAADAICRYVEGREGVMLAMSSHTRAGLRQTIFGSVTAECIRRAGVPILVYHAEPQD